MTNENKTVAQLMEGVEVDAERVNFKYAGIGIESHLFVSVGEACKHIDRLLIEKISSLYSLTTITRVFGPVLAELHRQIANADMHAEGDNNTIASLGRKINALEEHISAQAALLVQQERDLEELRKERKHYDSTLLFLNEKIAQHYEHRAELERRITEMRASVPTDNKNVGRQSCQMRSDSPKAPGNGAALTAVLDELEQYRQNDSYFVGGPDIPPEKKFVAPQQGKYE